MASPISLGKDRGRRVDFEDDFDILVRQKGYRAYWSRGIFCPCRLNSQTEQTDPTCDVCGGDGWFYVCPDDVSSPALYADETPPFTDRADALATQFIVQSVTRDPQIFEKFGEWIFGSARVTSFSFMPLQYRDRIVIVDETMIWQQTIDVGSSPTIETGRSDPRKKLRYPAIDLLGIWEVTTGDPNVPIDHKAGACVNAGGSITYDPTAIAGERVTVVYTYNPILIVADHVHGMRASPVKVKTTKVLGDALKLPLHAMVRLDFLTSPGTASGGGGTL